MVYNKNRGRACAGVRKIGRGSDMGVNILFGLVFGVWEISVFEEMLCQLKT